MNRIRFVDELVRVELTSRSRYRCRVLFSLADVVVVPESCRTESN